MELKNMGSKNKEKWTEIENNKNKKNLCVSPAQADSPVARL